MVDARQFGAWVSEEAQSLFHESANAPIPPTEIADLRKFYDIYNQGLLGKALDRYAVTIVEREIAGVRVHDVTPAGGAKTGSTLLCLHGGGFMWGDGAGALLEAVPVAAVAGMRVIAVDYRMAPEHVFPAAVDDVLAVYAALLSEQNAASIGIFGCSAGAMLTSEAIARIASEELPMAGAAALLHGAGLEFGGDSGLVAQILDPKLAAQGGALPNMEDFPYFTGADAADPLVLPGHHPDCLALFPPTMLVTAMRDFAASAVSVMHRRLLAAGVGAQLVMFDGLWHAHHMDVSLPESRETYDILAQFFLQHLSEVPAQS
ncbi:alpha/beta hydrolase [Sphingopyxis sp.]|uniref:alpha/beta hydrolase n=1 Tax=Sphingopyxis sp. TaxID=1908224 RepID=UPI003BA993C0